jgi:hypothetical protein
MSTLQELAAWIKTNPTNASGVLVYPTISAQLVVNFRRDDTFPAPETSLTYQGTLVLPRANLFKGILANTQSPISCALDVGVSNPPNIDLNIFLVGGPLDGTLIGNPNVTYNEISGGVVLGVQDDSIVRGEFTYLLACALLLYKSDSLLAPGITGAEGIGLIKNAAPGKGKSAASD